MATIPELLDGHITLEVECIDRLYLNGYVPKLATGSQLSMFMRFQLGKPVPSPVVLGQVSEKFREAVKMQAEREDIPIYRFDHKERKDDIANNFRRQRQVRDGIVFIGVAQEKAQTFSGKKVNGQFEFNRDKPVYVNHYYFYIDDADFGPLFLKVCSYAPWSTKLCLNGHEWAKRQLEKKKIAYEALDNGFLSCAEPAKLQQICDRLGPEDIDRVFRKWLRRVLLPLRPEDREAGYDWNLSIWQMEVSLTQIFDRPLRGRAFFEEMIRDNLDLGRPDRVQLIFGRRVTKKTPGEFRTRVIQEGVHPTLHIEYKNFECLELMNGGQRLLHAPKACERDRGSGVAAFLQTPEQFEAVHARHDEIRDDDVCVEGGEPFHRFLPVGRDLRVIGAFGKHGSQGGTLALVIIDDEDPAGAERMRAAVGTMRVASSESNVGASIL